MSDIVKSLIQGIEDASDYVKGKKEGLLLIR